MIGHHQFIAVIDQLQHRRNRHPHEIPAAYRFLTLVATKRYRRERSALTPAMLSVAGFVDDRKRLQRPANLDIAFRRLGNDKPECMDGAGQPA